MPTMSLSVISALLEVYVTPEKAKKFAIAIHEDMQSIGFSLSASRFNTPMDWRKLGVIPQSEYELPSNQFDLNSTVGSEPLTGSFLTCGNLLRLGQCAILGRRYIPHLWPTAFKPRLVGREHLDTLNEIWWLKFWRGVENVQRGPKSSPNDPDFEWTIDLRNGLERGTINLEVKRRTSNINQFFKKGRPNASVNKIAKKFQSTGDGTANIAAVTLYHNVPPEIDHSVREWLDRQPHLHGLVIWTEGNFGGIPLKGFFKESHRWAERLLTGPDPEDLMVAGRSAGTLCEVKDVPAFLDNLARKAKE